MTMSLDLEALETSFDLVAPRGDELMDEFYRRLFETAPAVTPLFAGADLHRQKTMLLGTLVLLRKSLRDLDAIVPKLRELGARHVAYGAEPEHYPVVGEVLIAAMAHVAGAAWLPEYERAWSSAFAIVAGAMLDAPKPWSSTSPPSSSKENSHVPARHAARDDPNGGRARASAARGGPARRTPPAAVQARTPHLGRRICRDHSAPAGARARDGGLAARAADAPRERAHGRDLDLVGHAATDAALPPLARANALRIAPLLFH
jgi:hemoglobin-like flavoprotein